MLHTTGDKQTGRLWKIVSDGPKVYSKEDLNQKGYPSDEPSQSTYLVIEIEPVSAAEFENIEWDFRELKNYKTGQASPIPFTASLAELMKHKEE